MSEQCHTGESCGTTAKTTEKDCCNMPERLLTLADDAWYELLKEKMKAEIQKSCGDNMDKIAKLVTETNCAKWSHMVTGKVKCDEYKQQLKDIMVAYSTKS